MSFAVLMIVGSFCMRIAVPFIALLCGLWITVIFVALLCGLCIAMLFIALVCGLQCYLLLCYVDNSVIDCFVMWITVKIIIH